MAGTPIEEFTTLAASVGPSWATGPESVINDAISYTSQWTRWASGKDVSLDLIQAGHTIQGTIFLDYVSTFQRVNPNVKLNVQNPQTGDQWTIKWSIAIATMGWTEPEIDFSVGPGATGSYRTNVYADVLYQKHQNLWTDVMESLDAEMTAVPDQVLMESSTPTDARIPYSWLAGVNEYNTNTTAYLTTPVETRIGGLGGAGLIPATIDAGGTPWETFQGINPTTSGKTTWRPYQGAYTYNAGPTTADEVFEAASSLFSQLSVACRKTSLMRLGGKGSEYSDPYTSPNVIYTSTAGIAYYENLLMLAQDHFRGVGKTSGQDPAYDEPMFKRIPIQVVEKLDTVAFYADALTPTAGVTEDVAHFAGPRFYGINGKFWKPVVHRNKYCVMTQPSQPDGQPLSWVQYMKLYNNNYCMSRRRNFCLRPAA